MVNTYREYLAHTSFTKLCNDMSNLYIVLILINYYAIFLYKTPFCIAMKLRTQFYEQLKLLNMWEHFYILFNNHNFYLIFIKNLYKTLFFEKVWTSLWYRKMPKLKLLSLLVTSFVQFSTIYYKCYYFFYYNFFSFRHWYF